MSRLGSLVRVWSAVISLCLPLANDNLDGRLLQEAGSSANSPLKEIPVGRVWFVWPTLSLCRIDQL